MRTNMLFIAMVAALALSGVFLFPPLSWSQTAPTTQYAPGWLARIISVPKDFKVTDSVPPTELGKAVATKSKYELGEYRSLVKNIPPIENVLWVGEAFLKAEEAGYYVFSCIPDYSGYNRIELGMAVRVDDTVIASSSNTARDLIPLMGAAELEPGLYKVEFRIVGDVRMATGFDLRVKRPSDNRPLPISQVLLLPVTKK